MRYMEEAARVVAKIMGLKGEDKDPKAIDVVHEAYSGLLEVNAEWLREQPVDTIVEVLTNTHGFNEDKLEATAELLFWEAKFQHHAGACKIADLCVVRALRMLEYLEAKSKAFSMQRSERIKTLRELIA